MAKQQTRSDRYPPLARGEAKTPKTAQTEIAQDSPKTATGGRRFSAMAACGHERINTTCSNLQLTYVI